MRSEKGKNSKKNKLLDIIRLRICYASGKDYILTFAYSDIKSEEIQKQLGNIYFARKNGNVKRIECLCKSEKRALVHIKKIKNRYVIASNPHNKQKHNNHCLLGTCINEYVNIEREDPKLRNFNIFALPYFSSSRKSYNKRTPKEQEKTRRLTFGLLMGLTLGNAYQFAFASKNKIEKQKISRCSPRFPAKMPTNEEVIGKFYPKFKELFHENGKYSFKEFTKNYILKAGIVRNFNYIEQNPPEMLEMEVICHLGPKDLKGKILELTIPRQQISNLILSEKAFSPSEPPLFIAWIEDKKNCEITRAYVYPLLYSDKVKPFIPVDSKHERSFISKIHSQGLKFIKPLRVNLTWHLFFTSLDIYKYIINYTYTPDLIIFKSPSIIFVEIIDKRMVFHSPYYKYNLENKRKSCNKIKNIINQEVKNCHILCLESENPEELIRKLKTN